MTPRAAARAALLLAVVVPTLALGEEPAVLRGAVKQQLILDETLLKSIVAYAGGKPPA